MSASTAGMVLLIAASLLWLLARWLCPGFYATEPGGLWQLQGALGLLGFSLAFFLFIRRARNTPGPELFPKEWTVREVLALGVLGCAVSAPFGIAMASFPNTLNRLLDRSVVSVRWVLVTRCERTSPEDPPMLRIEAVAADGARLRWKRRGECPVGSLPLRARAGSFSWEWFEAERSLRQEAR